MSSRNMRSIAFLLLLVTVGLTYMYMQGADNRQLEADIAATEALSDSKADFDTFADHLEDVAQTRGSVHAFTVMQQSELPFGLDTHLLGHVVGDILYEQEGINGMQYCTHDFRNACSHTIVIGAFMEYGGGAASKIRDACHLAPGGDGAYTLCFHGLGHGVLAYTGYDMEQTVDLCQQFGTEEYDHQEAEECFGGAVMEIIGGGGHDTEIWEEQRAQYLSLDEPLGFCLTDMVPAEFKEICITYMTPQLFESLHASMSYPGKQAFQDAFLICDTLATDATRLRDACFGGIGKEFPGFATGRNYRLSYEPNIIELNTMYRWCLLAPHSEAVDSCLRSISDSLYWGGERPYETTVTFCSIILNQGLQQSCYQRLYENVERYNTDDTEYYTNVCADVPAQQTAVCRDYFAL